MMIPMKIVNWKVLKNVKNSHGVDVRKLHDSGYVQIVNITLKPGEKLKKHITPVDDCLLCSEGEGIVEIGDEKNKVKSDTLIYSPVHMPHCWYKRKRLKTEIPCDKDAQTIRPIKTAITLLCCISIWCGDNHACNGTQKR